MSQDALTFERLDIIRAPGYPRGGFTVEDLSPGVNILHGPNASGKTTLARSLQEILWPSTAPQQARLIGRFTLDGDAWRAELSAQKGTYQRDGQPAERPGLPPADQRDRYNLSLHELLQHETRNETFANTIQRESAGGYDVSQAADELDFEASVSTRGLGAVKQARAAIDRYRDAKKHEQALRNEHQELPRLRQELERIEHAQRRVAVLDQAIKHAQARQALRSAESELEPFPEILDEMRGDELDTVEDLEGRIQQRQTQRDQARENKDQAQAALEEADLPREGLPDGLLKELEALVERAAQQETEISTLEASLEEAREKRSNAFHDIPVETTQEALAELDPVAWGELQRFAKDAQSLHAEEAAHQAVQRWLDTPQDETEASVLQRGRQALEGWLAAPAPTGASNDRARTLAIVAALVLAAASAALGLAVHPGFLALLAGAAGILWYGFQGSGEPREAQAAYEASYRQLPLEDPAAWEQEPVNARLNEIYDALAQHRLVEEKTQRHDALAPDIERLQEDKNQLDEERERLIERFGVAPDTEDIELFMLAQAVSRWQKAHQDVQGLRKRTRIVQRQLEDTLDQIHETIEPYGYERPASSAKARRQIQTLSRRGTRHREARRAIEDATDTIRAADAQITKLEDDRDAVYEDAGLEPGRKGKLRDLCRQVEAYEEAKRNVDRARDAARRTRKDLEALDGVEPELEHAPVPKLETMKREAQAKADEYQATLEEKNRIETRIREAKKASNVEEALAEKERALDELQSHLEDDYGKTVGHVLVEHAREATGEDWPAVFEHANEILARITMDRYRLNLDDEGTFRAVDTIKEKGFPLDALSSATRLQVLLAVRLAFAEHEEKGAKLPLLLDETLANTDDAKAKVLMDSMIRLAADGRQVFYFTAQGDEVAKWKKALEDANVPSTFIDLARVQDLDDHVEIPELDEVHVRTPVPPAPSDHDHASYADALDVDPFDPRKGAGAAHLWYIVQDVDLLHHVLELGIERWGQLKNLLDRGGDALVTDDAERLNRIERAGVALEEFVHCWQRGRGEPVTRSVLEETGAVTETFIDDVAELCEELNGDAERVVEALREGRVDRFRESKKDELEAFFEENGFIEAVDPLSPERIRLRMMQTVSGAGSEDPAGEVDALLGRLHRRSIARVEAPRA